MRLTERKRTCLCAYAEYDDILQKYKFKSVDSEKLCNSYISTNSNNNY